jgi:hypothetical protein
MFWVRRKAASMPSPARFRALSVAGLAAVGLTLSFAGMSTAAAAMRPPGVHLPPGGVFKLPSPPVSPGLYQLASSQQAVTVSWYDRSTDEQQFVVYKRDLGGNWEQVYEVPSRDVAGADGDYTWVDTDHSVSGQCYMIAAVNYAGAGDSGEECTVRPDPSQFPQSVSQNVQQWFGLNGANDGTGDLFNASRNMSLTHANQTFGVDLDYSENPALWRIEAQGGPQLMYGQAVALRVWGGGWLKYGNETWGVDLVLSNTPSYEWHLVGEPPGTPIANGSFALWNSATNRYLVASHQTWGVSLDWKSDTSTSTGAIQNASVTMTAQPPVQGYVPFLGYFGGGPGNTSVLTQVSNSGYGVTLFFIKPGHQSSECGNSSAVITLPPGATMTAAQMQTLYGSATPSLAQRIPFLACAATNHSSVSVNVQYRDQ